MSTYVQIDREDIERWLTRNRWDWKRKPGTAGIYLLELSPGVAISFSSTVGGADTAKGHADASANMRLISLITGQTLNKKARGQSRFHRTLKWEKNWQDGLLRLRAAYEKSQGFYDAIAEIEDRVAYKAEMIERVEAFDNWTQMDFLSSLHERLVGDGVLTIKQKEALERMESRRPQAAPAPGPATQSGMTTDDMLYDLRALWVAVPDERDFISALASRVKRDGAWSRAEGQAVDQLLRDHRQAVEQAKRSHRQLKRASEAFLVAEFIGASPRNLGPRP